MEQTKLKVVNVWNTFDGKIGVSYYEGEERKTTEIRPDLYFAINLKDNEKAQKILINTSYEVKYEIVPDFVKIHCHLKQRNDIVLLLEDSEIETFEGDLMPDRRWYIDKQIEVSNKYRKLYFDIETDDSKEKIEIGKERVLSFAAIDDEGKKYFIPLKYLTDEAELDMMKKILRLINKFDIVLGWNSSEFDIPYLRERMVKYGLHKTKDYRWKELARFDLLKRFRHILRFDIYLKKFNLNFVANYFLGKGKLDHSGERIIDLYNNNKEKLKEYNIEDCILVKELDEKLGVSDMMIRQCQWCGVPASQFGLYSIIDAYILKQAHSIGKFGKTSLNALNERNAKNEKGNMNPNETSTDKAKYMGAIVLDPIVGMYGKVYVFDYKSLYPSMMITSNIGYDSIRLKSESDCLINPGTLTINRKSGPIIPTYFVKTPSVITMAISHLITLRSEYKKLKLKMIEEGTNHGPEWDKVHSDEVIVKELSNSTYGIMGLEYGRYFNVDVAESITLFGQWVIIFARDYFNSIGYNVIYGDTDSIFVDTSGEIMDVEKELEKYHIELKKALKEKYNIDKSIIQLNFDKEYNSFILVAKKSYTGHVVNIEGKKTDDIYARGLDYIKRNTFSYAALKQKELIDMFLHKKITTPDECREWVKKTKEEFDAKEFTIDELTISMKVNKSIESYKTVPLHVRLVKDLQERTGQTFTNVEIDYIITDSLDGMNGVLVSDYTGGFDRLYYWTNKTRPVLQRITDAVFPNEEIFEPIPKKVRIKKIKEDLSGQLTLF